MSDHERFTIIIEAERGRTPAVQRLRVLLKRLRRTYGFRAVEVRPVGRPEQQDAAGATPDP